MLKKILDKLLDIPFPQVCLSCKKYLEEYEDRENLLCKKCFSGISIFKVSFLTPSGKFFALGSYEDQPLRELVHYLKYKGLLSTLVPIRKLVDRYLAHSLLPNDYDLVVPIPLHPSRKRKRSFNQSELIAETFTKKLSLPMDTIGLRRVRDTERQTSLKSNSLRAKNVKNCFKADKGIFVNKSVLLVDDVYTSGATIREAIRALKRGSARKIDIFVLLKTG